MINAYNKGDLSEIIEIPTQLKSQDKRATNEAVQDLRRSEKEVLNAEKEIRLFHIEATESTGNMSLREGGETPTPGPMTPGAQGPVQGAGALMPNTQGRLQEQN